MATSAACAFVGVAFLLAGLTKSLDGGRFVAHVQAYRLLPRRLLGPACLVLVAFEWGLGTASVGRVAPGWTLPVAAVLLAGLTGLSLWGARTGRVQTCGCYGDLVRLTPRQNAALNLALIGAAAAALVLEPAGAEAFAVDTASAWPVPAAGLLGGGLWWWSLRRGPLVDLTAARPGRRWRPAWLDGPLPVDPTRGTWVVAFLSPECPQCRVWAKCLNRLADLRAFDGIVAVIVAGAEEPAPANDLRFPATLRPSAEVFHLVPRVPTALLLRDGVIAERWRALPAPYVELLRGVNPDHGVDAGQGSG